MLLLVVPWRAAGQQATSHVAITTDSLPRPVLHQNYFAEPRVAGGLHPLKWQLAGGSLPPGITLDVATGLLAGVPVSAGEFRFTVRVTDSSKPPQSATREFVLKVVPPLSVEWRRYPKVDGQDRVGGAVVITNATRDAFDLTFISVAVNEIGKAFALGYQHFTLSRDSTTPELDFGSVLPAGTYIVHVDVVAEVPSSNTIHRARLQTSVPMTVTNVP